MSYAGSEGEGIAGVAAHGDPSRWGLVMGVEELYEVCEAVAKAKRGEGFDQVFPRASVERFFHVEEYEEAVFIHVVDVGLD